MSDTEQTRELITRMVSALNDHVIDGQDSFWRFVHQGTKKLDVASDSYYLQFVFE